MNVKETVKETTASPIRDPMQTEGDISCSHIKTEIKTEEEQLLGKSGGYLCPICARHFFLTEYFIKHVNEHHSKKEDYPECDNNVAGQECLDSMLPSASVTDSGMLNVSKTDESDCSLNAASQNVSLGAHAMTHDNHEKLFKCPEANCLYTTRKHDLRRHAMTHTVQEKQFKCPEAGCSYAATTKSHLRIHVVKHSGDRPFTCPEADCFFTTTRKPDLRRHAMTHDTFREKQFKCPEADCSYAASQKSNLRTHAMTHDTFREKQFKCPEAGCSYAASKKSHLRIHVMKHSGDRPFKCPEADCLFNTAHKHCLRTHAMIHTGERPFKCSDCSYAAIKKRYLEAHVTKAHT